MLIVKRLRKFGKERPGSVASLGVFDGIHLGHQAILKKLVAIARKRRHDAVALTFDPPPQSVLGPRKKHGYLTSLEEKEAILERAGVDVLGVIRFDRTVAELSPEEFVERVLVAQLRVSHFVCGSDCGYGKGRSGNLLQLRELGRRHGFGVTEVKPMRLCGGKISSTAIKKALADGDLDRANRMLGRPYSIRGRVVPGLGLGRKLGYPTINLEPNYSEKLLPAHGVYAAKASIKAKSYTGLLYIGRRPTIKRQGNLSIEFHSLKGRPTIRAGEAKVFLLKRLRAETKFRSLQELTRAIGGDAAAVRRLLGVR